MQPVTVSKKPWTKPKDENNNNFVAINSNVPSTLRFTLATNDAETSSTDDRDSFRSSSSDDGSRLPNTSRRTGLYAGGTDVHRQGEGVGTAVREKKNTLAEAKVQGHEDAEKNTHQNETKDDQESEEESLQSQRRDQGKTRHTRPKGNDAQESGEEFVVGAESAVGSVADEHQVGGRTVSQQANDLGQSIETLAHVKSTSNRFDRQ